MGRRRHFSPAGIWETLRHGPIVRIVHMMRRENWPMATWGSTCTVTRSCEHCCDAYTAYTVSARARCIRWFLVLGFLIFYLMHIRTSSVPKQECTCAQVKRVSKETTRPPVVRWWSG